MNERPLASSLGAVADALRDPEAFARRWHEGGAGYRWWIWGALAASSVLGVFAYGMTMGLLGDAGDVLARGAMLTLAAFIAWALPLPGIYILNSISGSRLSASTTALAALVCTSFGALAMLASIPINWFFTVALPDPRMVLATNLVIFAGVGVSMADVFGRIFTALEPGRGRAPSAFLLIVGAIGAELFYAFDLFDFTRLAG